MYDVIVVGSRCGGSPTARSGDVSKRYDLDAFHLATRPHVREATTVTALISSDNRVTGIRCRGRSGEESTEHARIVIGADGRHSLVAKQAGAAEYNVRPVLTCALYAYWRDVAPHLVAIHPLPQRVAVSFPTNDGLTITPVIFPRAQLPQILANPEAHLVAALRMVPSLAEPFSGASRVERIRIMGNIPNFFRKPHGDAWALVGDAGYHKDPILAQGISDALRSAEWLADAIHAGFSGAQPLGDALDMYARQRDAHFQPMYALGGGHTLCDMAVIRRRPDKGTDLTGAHLHGHADEADQGGHLCIPYLSPSFLRMSSSRCVRRRSHVRANDPGVGVSHPVSNKSQFGIEMGQPLQVLRPYVDDVRRCMRREGPAFLPNSSPAPYPVPIYVAALTSKALEQAAEITDGIMPVFWPVSRVKQSQVWITRGHAKAPERPKELIRCRPLSKPFICDDNCGKPARSAVTR